MPVRTKGGDTDADKGVRRKKLSVRVAASRACPSQNKATEGGRSTVGAGGAGRRQKYDETMSRALGQSHPGKGPVKVGLEHKAVPRKLRVR